MKKVYYLMSGLDKEFGFSKEVKEALKRDIHGGRLVVISSTFSKKEKNDKYHPIIIHWFTLCGISFEQIDFIDARTEVSVAQDLVREANVVFLSGGDTLQQIKWIKEYGLIDILRNRNGVTIGVSAGSINMAVHALCIKDEEVEETVRYDGIGLVDINIEPHFDLENQEYNQNNLYPESFQNEIICLPNASALRVDEEGGVTYIGECFSLKKGILKKIKKKEVYINDKR